MTDNNGYLYRESITAPRWLFVLFLGGLAAVGFLVGLESTRHYLAGPERVRFFVFTGIGMAFLGFVCVNFLVMTVGVTGQAIEFSYGVFRRHFRWAQVSEVRVSGYDWRRYGGWGLRFGLQGRRAWAVPGVPEGITLSVDEGGRQREYFVSSRNPADLSEAIVRASASSVAAPSATPAGPSR